MRVIIKPLGLVVIVGSLVAGIAVPQFIRSSRGKEASSQTTVGNLVNPRLWNAYGTAGGEQETLPLQSPPPGIAANLGTRIETKKFTNEPWAIGYTQEIAARFAKDEMVTLSFWARSREPQHLRVAMQFPSHAYHECWNKEVNLTPVWKNYRYSFRTETFQPKEGSLAFQTGFRVGWVELADITLIRGE